MAFRRDGGSFLLIGCRAEPYEKKNLFDQSKRIIGLTNTICVFYGRC